MLSVHRQQEGIHSRGWHCRTICTNTSCFLIFMHLTSHYPTEVHQDPVPVSLSTMAVREMCIFFILWALPATPHQALKSSKYSKTGKKTLNVFVRKGRSHI